MNVRYCNRISKIHHIFPAVFLIILAAFLVTPTALAGKPGGPKCNPHKTTCPPGPDQFPAGQDKDTMGFFGDAFSQITSDNIYFKTQGLDFDSGDFVVDGDSPGIVIDTRYLSKLQLKGGPRSNLCRQLEKNDIPLYPDTFSYGWIDNCTDGSCAVQVRVSFSAGIDSLTGGESDHLELVMHATIDDPGEFVNPFTEYRELQLHMIDADYRKPGTTRSAVQCQWSVAGAGTPLFHSFPQEP